MQEKVDTKKTVIVGASPNPQRFAYRAAHMLSRYGYPIVPVGIKKGEVAGKEIQDFRQQPQITDVDTVTLYVGPGHQPVWYDFILGLQPKRIIFNPGTENRELEQKAREQNIKVVHGCTLVMLQSGNY